MSEESSANSDWRVVAAQTPPEWSGDLDDDCTALWAGFMLRAEQMDEDWWWCVYLEGSNDQVASSNGDDAAVPTSSGEAARAATENAARRLLGLE